jgi:large subunit ribosomal protein L23
MNCFDIIKTVRISEKGAMQSERHNQYTVVADRTADKVQIRRAVEELFKVKVVRVNTLNVTGRERRKNTKHAGREEHWKKAIVTLKQGQKINLT